MLRRMHLSRRPVLVALAVLLTLAGGTTACSGQVAPTILLPPEATVDQAIPLRAEGLAPGSPVTVRAATADAQGRPWTSVAELVTDAGGRIDTATSSSSGGTYTGVDVAGPFWSMRPPPGVNAAPYPFLSGTDADVDVELLSRDAGAPARELARTTVRRPVAEPAAGVTATPFAEAGLVGDLYVPQDRPGPHPGVLLLGGSEGGRPDPAYATLLASRGYVVLGLAYFGVDGLAPELSGIPVEYGLAAADRLAARPEVAGQPIGVHGTSKGAEYALLLATSAPRRFDAVVAIVPSDLVWPGLAPGPPRSSWTRDGVDVPFAQATGPDASSAEPAPLAPGEAMRTSGFFEQTYAAMTPHERATARIPTERIEAPVLLVSGGDDGIWPSTPQAERAAEPLRARGEDRVRVLDHPHGGHFVGGVPNLPATVSAFPAGPFRLEGGGQAAANARARVDTLDQVLAIFAQMRR